MAAAHVTGLRMAGVLAAMLLAGCADFGSPDLVLGPAPAMVNEEAGGVALEAENVPMASVVAFAPLAARFAALQEEGAGYAAAARGAAGTDGFVLLDRDALEAAFAGTIRRHYFLDTGGGATNLYSRDPDGLVGGQPQWRLLSTGGTRYARYGFETRDGIARICMSGESARCGAAFADGDGVLGVLWARAEGGVTPWVYGPPTAAAP